MAKRRSVYLLTTTAEQDIREARRWSLSRWGKELTQQYFADLHASAQNIARNHQRITSAEYLTDQAELKIHPVREHYFVYVPINKGDIVIVALIRQTQDVPAILRVNGFKIKWQLKEISEKLEQGKIPNLKK